MGTPTTIDLYTDAAGEWRWRLKDPSNGEIVAASTEGYKDKGDAEANVQRVAILLSAGWEFVNGDGGASE